MTDIAEVHIGGRLLSKLLRSDWFTDNTGLMRRELAGLGWLDATTSEDEYKMWFRPENPAVRYTTRGAIKVEVEAGRIVAI